MSRLKTFLHHLFLPHHSNNFKPRILHGNVFLLYAIFFFTLSVSLKTLHRINPAILGYATNINVEQLLSLTNQKRAEAGLPALTYNGTLAAAAAAKAANMFGEGYWAHNSPSGKTPWDFIIGAGYRYVYAGENLAKNFSDSGGVVDAWMASPSHRENIMRSQYDEVGFAVVNGNLAGEETTLVVQMFGRPQTVAQAPATALQAQAAEEKPVEVTPASQTAQLAQIMPTPLPSQTPVALFASAVVKKPLIDVIAVTKRFSIAFSIIIMATLVVDGLYVWRKKIVRISGRNLAHVFFLTAMTGIIWLATKGAIL